ncbi:diacylglycerol kinase [Catenovulum agarivorans DS-2]|uniref:Diacylglycerol kinase n=1 Tax=Catenovulum agarivorans DS-2 TaxID=1328313 RepID=W7QRK9_9ALTE|nr:diacylglycerol kinase [Catenovulum agarivorans]EWH11617.1 diacylglycerol kinase [Catenovulum agarivorans DS-2]
MKNKQLNTGIVGYRPFRKIKVACKGVYLAVLSDFSVAYKLVMSVVLMVAFFYFRQWLDFSLVLLATALVLVAEMFNTALEALCDFVEPKQNQQIGLIKDVAAGAVGVCIFIWTIIILIEIYRAAVLLEVW